MEFDNDNIKVNNYPALSKSEVKNVLTRCQQLVKTSNKFQDSIQNLAESWQELTEDLDKLLNLKEMYFISNILNSDKDSKFIISENRFYSNKIREMNDFLSDEYIEPIRSKTEELQKKVSNKKVEKALKHDSKNRKNSNTDLMVQKSIFNNNYEIFQCIITSSNKLINYVDRLFLKPQVANVSKRRDSINQLQHKMSFSNHYSPSEMKAIYNNNIKNQNINHKPYNLNNSFSFNPNSPFQNGAKFNKSFSASPNTKYEEINDENNNNNNNMNPRDSNGPLSSLNKELNFEISEIPNIKNGIREGDDIIASIGSPKFNNDLPHHPMNEAYKFVKKQQQTIGHNRSHSVGADPFNNSSLMTQEKCLNLINGSPIPKSNSISLGSPFNNPPNTTNIDSSSKIPSLTSIVNTPPVVSTSISTTISTSISTSESESGSSTTTEITRSKSQPLSHTSNILNMLNNENENNEKFHRKTSTPELKSYIASSNIQNISSLNISEIENIQNNNKVMGGEKSYCENESFSISQSTIKFEHQRKNSDSIFDNEISFNNEEENIIPVEENSEIKRMDMSDGIDDMSINDNVITYKNESEKKTDNNNTNNMNNMNNINNINNTNIEDGEEIVYEEEIIVIEEKENIIEDTSSINNNINNNNINNNINKIIKKNSSRNKRNEIKIETDIEVKSIKSTASKDDDKTPTYPRKEELPLSHSPVKSSKSVKINSKHPNNVHHYSDINKTDLNIDIKKLNENKSNVKRSKSINIFKSHERSRSLTDMKFDKKHILGIIFNKKDSNSSKKSQNSPTVPSKMSPFPIIKKSNSTANSDTKSVRSNSSNKSSEGNGNVKEKESNGFRIPDFNFNNFIKSNSPIVNRKLQRRHSISISSPEKASFDHDQVYYNNNNNNNNNINKNELNRNPVPIDKDNEKISLEEIQASLFNVSSISNPTMKGNNDKQSDGSQSPNISNTSSQLRRERIMIGIQKSPSSSHKSGSSSINNDKSIKKENLNLQLNHFSDTPNLQNAINNILNKELPEIKVSSDEKQNNNTDNNDNNNDNVNKNNNNNSLEESQDIMNLENLPIYNSADIENIPIYTESEIDIKEDSNGHLKVNTNTNTTQEDDTSTSKSYDKTNGSIMSLINKNWKLLSEDYVDINNNINNNKNKNNKNNNIKKPEIQSSTEYLNVHNNMDEISPILPPLSKSLNINMVNAFATVENEFLEKKQQKVKDEFGIKNMNQQYIQCMDNLGNPFLNPDMNGLEISENEAYKGKATICSPSIEVESIIGSILDVEDEGDEEEEYNDDDEAFEKQMENINIIPETIKKDKNDNLNNKNTNKNSLNNNNNNNNDDSNKENIIHNTNNNIGNQFLRSNKNSDLKNSKNNVVASVTSFRKYSLPTSNLNKVPSEEGKYLQRSKSNNKYTPLESLTPLSSNLSKNNNSESSNTNNSNTTKSYHKNKKYERIIAVHDYKGRDNREMSLEKGDVLIVKQRKGTWIYGVKESNIFKLDLITNQQIKFEHREHGWVPSTYIKPYNTNSS
ncbi:hypothetical protein BCR32DRAFT_294038 [Anaeromyces robustus]|uniref:SH3 domain-containing protein n=1 Tax=Anaeromyces robustus TaxID=1754192 RepID=A0A1Y1X2N2_9FUNG|nr:hypothetical protein BCR32DRAFT_294038 [Anaeromyces robustus]|eukprot:ORX80057.1 hypothetical protein BCR32DRAFT_294038 [Anaeromyces robustus]